MDLELTPQQEAFRVEARDWLAANVPGPLPSVTSDEGIAAHVAWERQLYEAKWAVLPWPEQYGGRNASLMEWLLFEEEYYRAGAPNRVTQNGIFLLAPALLEFGTEEQKERLLRPMAAAETIWAQGWSEPNAGSDLAAVRSTAVRVDGGWKLSGQKTWSTRATVCQAVHGLFRTDPDADRPHRGLTYFMVPLDAEGVQVNGFRRLDGDLDFAEIFFDDVFVADRDVLGAVNGGWKVAMSTTGSERGLVLRSPGRFIAAADRLVDLYRRQRASCGAQLRHRVVDAWMDAQAYNLFTLQAVTRINGGTLMGADSSVNKIAWSEMDVDIHETALDILGPLAELDGEWMKAYQFALAGPIYAGTNEIQKNIIAERVLGLPRK